MKKKLLPILLLVVIIFNFIFCSSAYGSEPDDSSSGSSTTTRYGGNATIDGSVVEDMESTGQDSSGNTFSFSNFGDSIIGMIIQMVASVINSFPMAIESVITLITMNEDTDDSIIDAVSDISGALTKAELHFTIEKTVFNEVALFNIDVFNTDTSYTVGTGDYKETITQSSATILLKESAAGWYYSCRTMAMMINLCVLVYVGIRMAISSVASEEAKYKKLLINWVQSMIVLFLLHYIMMIIIQVGNMATNILYNIKEIMIANGAVSFESTIMTKIYSAMTNKSGIQLFMYSAFFWVLTYLHVRFFTKYFRRMLTVLFLSFIGPFITVTYPIDKMADNKAQAFNTWLKEYLVNVFIQPIHAAIYLVFIFTAGAIAERAPFVALIFLLSLGRIENIVKNIFMVQADSMGDLRDEKVKLPFVGGKK